MPDRLPDTGDASIRRLSYRASGLDLLLKLAQAESGADEARIGKIRERASSLGVLTEPPKPLLMGRDLAACGIPPGPDMGRLLDQCMEAQLDGRFATREEGLRYLRTLQKP